MPLALSVRACSLSIKIGSHWIPVRYPPLFTLEFEVQYPHIGRMITLPQLLDNAKCFETVRTLRWLDKVSCPHCGSEAGKDDT
jgi:hypothetical protein